MAISILFSTASEIVEALFRSFEKFEYIALSSIIEGLIKVILGLLALIKGYGLVALFMIIVSAAIMRLITDTLFIKRLKIRVQFSIDISFCRRLIKDTIIFAGILIVANIYWQISTIMLSKIGDMNDVGIYSAAYRLLSFYMIIPLSCGMAIFPIVSRVFESSITSFNEIFRRITKYLLIIVLPLIVGTAILGDKIILILFGNEFHGSILALRILVWALFPYSIVFILARLIVASGNQKIDFKINIMSLAINILLNVLLIPRLHYIGASIATLISIIVFMWLQFIYMKKAKIIVSLHNINIRSFYGVSIMGIFLFLLRNMNIFLLILFSACLYFASLLVMRVLTKEDYLLAYKIYARADET
jgi:O-antigen/teichoic acid export membrane protein